MFEAIVRLNNASMRFNSLWVLIPSLLVSCGRAPADREATPTPSAALSPAPVNSPVQPAGDRTAPGSPEPVLTESMLDDYFKLRPARPGHGLTRKHEPISKEALTASGLAPETFDYIDRLVEKVRLERGESSDPTDVMRQLEVTGAAGQYQKAMEDNVGYMIQRMTSLAMTNAVAESNRLRQQFDQKMAAYRRTNDSGRSPENPFARSPRQIANQKLVRRYLERTLGGTPEAPTAADSESARLAPLLSGRAPNPADFADLIQSARTSAAEKKARREAEQQAKFLEGVKGLQSEDTRERAKACEKLGGRDWGEHADTITSRLVWMLGQTNFAEQFAAMGALSKVKPMPNEGKAALLDLMQKKGPIRTQAFFTLYSAAPDDPDVVAAAVADPELAKFYEQMQKMKMMGQAMRSNFQDNRGGAK